MLAGSDDGRLYLLDLESGEEVWSYEIGKAITGSPAVAEGMFLVGCEDGGVYAFRSESMKESTPGGSVR